MLDFRKETEKSWALIVVTIILLLGVIFALIKQDNIILQIHDNLDSNIPIYKTLRDNHLFFQHDVKAPFLNGVNRDLLVSEIKLQTLVFFLFPTLTAYYICFFLRCILSIIGFSLISVKMLKNDPAHLNIGILCGFLYGILPYFPTVGISFSALPIVFVLVFEIYHYPSLKYYILLFFSTFLLDFAVMGFFVCGYLFLFFAIDSIRGKKLNLSIMLSLLVVSLGFVIADYRLFNAMLFNPVGTIRAVFKPQYLSFGDSVRLSWTGFVESQYHCDDLHKYVVMPVVLLVTAVMAIQKDRRARIMIGLLICISFNSLVYGFDNWAPLKHLIGKVVPALRGFSFARILWLNPFLWYTMFMVANCYLINFFRAFSPAVAFFFAFLIVLVKPAEYNEIHMNLYREKYNNQFTYKEFYAEELFEHIKKDIEYSGEKAVAFGFHPAVLMFNDIFTLDGYLSNYEYDYKLRFRQLIEPELEQDEYYRAYFDEWGGRAYLLSDQLDHNPTKTPVDHAVPLNIDSEVFSELGGVFVFSRAELSNYIDLNFSFVNQYSMAPYPYVIYVYKNEKF